MIKFLAVLAAFSFSPFAHGQFITWAPGTSTNGVNTFDITGASDIRTNGIYVDALSTHGNNYTDGSGGPVVTPVLNPTTGITTQFNVYTHSGSSGTSPGNFYADGTFSITADSNGGSDGSNSDATPYLKVLDGSTYAFTPEVGTVTMSGLTNGDQYQIQVWASAGYRPTTYTSGASMAESNFVSNSSGQYALGTFTAQGTTQTFTYQNSYPIDVSAGEINAVSLHDVTAIPEPSTYALFFAGAGVLLFFARLRTA